MIKITKKANGIDIVGHANYAPHGQDIVCSAVSILGETFIESVNVFLTKEENKKFAGGVKRSGEIYIKYDYESLSTESKLLVDSFLLGLRLIAQLYPEHVSFDSNGAD